MYEGVVQELIDELSRLPGVGPKSAQRIAFYLLQTDDDQAQKLAQVLQEVKERVRFCEVCGNVTEETQCNICRDVRRNRTAICVVEEPEPEPEEVAAEVAVQDAPKSRNSNMVDESARYGESLLREMLGAEPISDKNGK